MKRRTHGKKGPPRGKKRDKGARGPEHVSSRPAEGRERMLERTAREPLWARLALDAIARQRASAEPLDRALERVLRAARAGGRERRRAGDAAFAWARARPRVERAVDDALSRYGGVAPSRRDRDRAAMWLAELAAGVDEDVGALPEPLDALIDEARQSGAGPVLGGAPAPLPRWLEERLARAFGDEASALAEALGQPAPVVLAVDQRATSVDDVEAALRELGLDVERSRAAPGALRVSRRFPAARLPERLRAHVWPMDDGSQAVVHALSVQPGERVLDLCAGGGGKTRLLLALGAEVVAMDPDARRLDAARARAPEARFVVADGTRAPFATGSFDRVLVDAPCSGTGTLRRAPDLAARLSPEDVARFPPLQTALLEEAARLVRPGGRVVYATCSLLPEENDGVVDQAMASHTDLRARPLEDLSGYAGDAPRAFGAWRRALLPSTLGTDGFFVASLERAR